MEIPNWFGQNEYYALLYTIWFGLIVYFLTTILRVKKEIKIKEKIVKIKNWWIKRKENKNYY